MQPHLHPHSDDGDGAALDQVITVTEAAALTHYHSRSIRRWCAAGLVVAKLTPCGVWLISRQSLVNFVRARTPYAL